MKIFLLIVLVIIFSISIWLIIKEIRINSKLKKYTYVKLYKKECEDKIQKLKEERDLVRQQRKEGKERKQKDYQTEQEKEKEAIDRLDYRKNIYERIRQIITDSDIKERHNKLV